MKRQYTLSYTEGLVLYFPENIIPFDINQSLDQIAIANSLTANLFVFKIRGIIFELK